ncbi:MAG TPA: tRNA pseudouridine(55) synthase TruB [Dehalococcoidia bacterium]|nr:tRNA pseudouridine(55) synthase TruB [Dehalococcoidia bacterium]
MAKMFEERYEQGSPCSQVSTVASHCPKSAWDGILNINKPPGLTSFDVVARVRKLIGCKRVGHAGTLDPDATGVLLVCLGRATRVTGILGEARKTYRAEIVLGAATDTYDSSGAVTFTGNPFIVEQQQLERVLARFRGVIQQVPPIYSALKFHGRPSYELARSGVELELTSRPVCIHRLELSSWTPPTFNLEIECGKGTYVRSLAHDIGKELGCGAHLSGLERTRSGPFSVADALTIDELRAAVESGLLENFLHPVDSALSHWPAVILQEAEARKARNGRVLELPVDQADSSAGGVTPGPVAKCRAYDADGDFIGILEFDTEMKTWHPSKVFSRYNVDNANPCCGR